MTENRETLRQLLCCPVCLDDLEESGERIPRIFPCSHTVCQSCIRGLIQNSILTCPECSKKYKAENMERSFPQNKYLLAQIRPPGVDTCKKHRKELNLFCLEEKCKKVICLSCLQGDHKKHDVIDVMERKKKIVQEEKEGVLADIRVAKSNMQDKLSIISEAGKDTIEKTDASVRQLLDLARDFEKVAKELMTQKEETEREVSALRKHIGMLVKIEKDVNDTGKRVSLDVLETSKNEVNKIVQSNRENHSGTRLFANPDFTLRSQSFEEFRKTARETEIISVRLPEQDPVRAEKTAIPRNLAAASQLQCKGNHIMVVLI